MIDCVCGFGKNLKEKRCPICGTDLTPIHGLKELPKLYYNKALRLYEEERLDEAIGNLMTAITFDKNFSEAYMLLGDTYAKKGLYKEALLYWEKAKDISTDVYIIKKIENNIKNIQKLIFKEKLKKISLPLGINFLVISIFFMIFLINVSETFKTNKNLEFKQVIHTRIFFDLGSAVIKPQDIEVLDKLINYIKEHPNSLIRVEGYADGIGNTLFNEKLSKDRAQAVANYIINKLKENDLNNRIFVTWNGGVGNKINQENRRVDIYIYK